jgi:predicted metal-dependent hydrolase
VTLQHIPEEWVFPNHEEVRQSKEQNIRMNLERRVKICAEENHVTPEGSLHLRDTDTNNGSCLTQHVLDLSHGEASIL